MKEIIHLRLKITAEEQAFGAAYVVRLNELSIQQ